MSKLQKLFAEYETEIVTIGLPGRPAIRVELRHPPSALRRELDAAMLTISDETGMFALAAAGKRPDTSDPETVRGFYIAGQKVEELQEAWADELLVGVVIDEELSDEEAEAYRLKVLNHEGLRAQLVQAAAEVGIVPGPLLASAAMQLGPTRQAQTSEVATPAASTSARKSAASASRAKKTAARPRGSSGRRG